MTYYLVERYISNWVDGSPAADVEQVDADDPVRLLLTLYVPADEMCLHVFDAASAAALERVSRQAGIVLDRVIPVDLGRIALAAGKLDRAIAAKVDEPVSDQPKDRGRVHDASWRQSLSS